MADLGHICEVSGVGARVEMDRVPLSEAARAALDNDAGLVAQIAGGGDDYEILFVVPAGKADAIAGIAAETGVPVTRIGSILRADQGLSAVDGSGRQISSNSRDIVTFSLRPPGVPVAFPVRIWHLSARFLHSAGGGLSAFGAGRLSGKSRR